MVLLTLLAVGLLSLSTVSLRGSNSATAMMEARSNARLALELAIGQLQKEAGPDTRITASAALVDPQSPLGITGVWEAWKRPDLVEPQGDKDSKFSNWLTSGSFLEPDPTPSRVPVPTEQEENAIMLLGEQSLGSTPGMDLTKQYLRARPLTLSSDRSRGKLAWVTVDESVKARFDLQDPESQGSRTSLARRIARSAAPGRNGTFALKHLGELRPDKKSAAKMASFDTAVMGTKTPSLRSYIPHVTPWSMSLMTNPVDGGLKRDISTIVSDDSGKFKAGGNLFRHIGLPTGPSDPSLATLEEYHNLYKNIGRSSPLARRVSKGEMGAMMPDNLRPYIKRGNRTTPNPQTPDGMTLMPSILRVDMIFSLIARDPHGQWASQHQANGRQYMLHLLYLPVITIHNPYDIPLSFDSMKLTFQDVPVGFKFFLNDRPMTTAPAPLNNLFINQENSNASKSFGMTLKPGLNGSSTSIRLEPGQTKLLGTPGVPPSWTWNNEEAGTGKNGAALFDWRNDQTAEFDILPRLITESTTTGAGFDVDWLLVRSKTPFGEQAGISGTLGLKSSDRVGVEWGPIDQPNKEFSVTVEFNRRPAGIYRFQYGDVSTLTKVVSEGTSVRFPEKRSFPAMYPGPDDPPLTAARIYEPSSRAMKDYTRPQPFGVFSFSGKTTLESFVPARPYADSSTNSLVVDVDLSRGRQAAGDQPYELMMMPIQASSSVIEENRAEEEGYFFGGNGSQNGTPRAVFYEIPRLPLQSLAQFRHANLANSGTQPYMTYTVGESWAHPMLPTDRVQQPAGAGSSEMFDQTYLSNTALWDRYFLSTMCDYEGDAFGGAERDAAEVREDFFMREEDLLNPRFTPLVPAADSTTASESIAADDGADVAAAYLGLKGGFNVNSTSVEAWTAFLSSMRDQEIESQEKGSVDTGDSSAFPRVRYPADGAIDGGDDFFGGREIRWRGFRQLDEDQVSELAGAIVEEVRSRGPFLSLSEFVNRKLGSSSDEASLRGTIAAALIKAETNETLLHDGIIIDGQNMGTHDWVTPAAAMGSNMEGAPGSVSQGDILTALGSDITVRGDTFVIRAYGESDALKSGIPAARAWCEAVVQRMPDYVDPADSPETPIDDLVETNRNFGRRFEVLSFRWLAPGEI